MKLFHAKRLAKLAKFLQSIATNQFNINYYSMQNECGTVACVAGWAGLIPSFRKLGLRTNGTLITLKGRHYNRSSEAAAEFFGLTVDERRNLFYPSDYYYRRFGTSIITPKQAPTAILETITLHGYDANALLAQANIKRELRCAA